jgi:hypothetical protein
MSLTSQYPILLVLLEIEDEQGRPPRQQAHGRTQGLLGAFKKMKDLAHENHIDFPCLNGRGFQVARTKVDVVMAAGSHSVSAPHLKGSLVSVNRDDARTRPGQE